MARPWQVWLADLEPAAGREPGGRRPCVVVSSSLHCAFPIPMAIVVPLSTIDRGLPHHVPVGTVPSGLERLSWARTEDVRVISEQRLLGGGPLGVVAPAEREAIRGHVRLMIDF